MMEGVSPGPRTKCHLADLHLRESPVQGISEFGNGFKGIVAALWSALEDHFHEIADVGPYVDTI
jgi:hypothetical protein